MIHTHQSLRVTLPTQVPPQSDNKSSNPILTAHQEIGLIFHLYCNFLKSGPCNFVSQLAIAFFTDFSLVW